MNYQDRKFGFCSINWKIKNACVIICNSDWRIFSPDFIVRAEVPTKWRMALVPENSRDPSVEVAEDANPAVLFYLQNLNCNGISCIDKVEVLLNIEVGNTLVNPSPIHKSFEHLTKSFWVTLVKVNSMIPMGHSDFQPDDINLRCHLLVSFRNTVVTIEPSLDYHVEQLSKDLFEIFKKHYEYDVVIKMDDQKIKAHKCILRIRSEYFAKKIDRNPDKTDINIKSNGDFESLEKVLAFIYTGNPEFVLNKPSIYIFMLADQFKQKEVLDYYMPDKLDMCSVISCEEFCFSWNIKNFFRRFDPYIETSFTAEIDGISCKLRLYPRDVRHREFITFFAEITGGIYEWNICIEFAVKSGKRHVCLAKIQKIFSESKKLECMKVLKRSEVAKLSKSEDLVLNMKIRMSSAAYDRFLGKSEEVYMDPKENSYDKLCMDMKLMCTESIFKDVVIYSKSGRVAANKCILAVRSRHLYDLFDGRNFCRLSIEDDLLEELLHYLYSSTCRHTEPSRLNLGGIFKLSNNYLDCLPQIANQMY